MTPAIAPNTLSAVDTSNLHLFLDRAATEGPAGRFLLPTRASSTRIKAPSTRQKLRHHVVPQPQREATPPSVISPNGEQTMASRDRWPQESSHQSQEPGHPWQRYTIVVLFTTTPIVAAALSPVFRSRRARPGGNQTGVGWWIKLQPFNLLPAAREKCTVMLCCWRRRSGFDNRNPFFIYNYSPMYGTRVSC